jgi:hypothetical protein
MKAAGSLGAKTGRRWLDRPPRLRQSAHVAETGRDWKRLGQYVLAERVARGWITRDQFVDAIKAKVGRMTDRTIGNLERGVAVSDSTLAAVELTFDWEPGTCVAILAGRKPPQAQAMDIVLPADEADEELRTALRVLRRALGREKFFQWVEENSKAETDSQSDHTG